MSLSVSVESLVAYLNIFVSYNHPFLSIINSVFQYFIEQ